MIKYSQVADGPWLSTGRDDKWKRQVSGKWLKAHCPR